jgi:LppX_LprAFG lipoprotein
MTRRISTLTTLAVAAILVAACGPSAPALTDPTAIITAALTSTEAAKSVHLEATIDGSMTVAMPGSGGAAAPFKLDGTTAAADLDIAGAAAKVTFNAPALFNLAGELIVVDGKAYLKTTLQGDKYNVIDLGQNLPVDPSNPGSIVDNLGDFLLKPGVDPVKGDDVACGSKQCYTVKADLTADELAALGVGAATGLPVDLTGASLAVTVRVEKDLPNHLAGLTFVVTTGDGNALTLDAILSRWDEPVSIAAPPADQINGG